MKKEQKLVMLDSYIKMNVAPILLDGINAKVFDDIAVIIPASIDLSYLNGSYYGEDFVPPFWYQKIKLKENEKVNLLVIDNISTIPIKEQRKFIELLKYRKIGVFKLPKNCVIIITKEGNGALLEEEVYSLVAHIKD